MAEMNNFGETPLPEEIIDINGVIVEREMLAIIVNKVKYLIDADKMRTVLANDSKEI